MLIKKTLNLTRQTHDIDHETIITSYKASHNKL